MTLPNISATSIYNLTEMTFIGGTYLEFDYSVFDETNSPVDITTGTITWNLSLYGQPNFVQLTKSGTITGTNTFKVMLTASDTVNLSGKYVQQPVLQDFKGNIFVPAQGIINFLPKIQGS